MELAGRLEEFFKSYQHEISVNELVKKFRLNKKETQIVTNCLYDLECEGKIIGDEDGNYRHKPDDYYLYQGVIRKSNKNKYYIMTDNGIVNILYNNLNGANVDDIVYVGIRKGTKHIKQLEGKVIRIIKKPIVGDIKTFYKAKLMRNHMKRYYYVKIDGNTVYIDNDKLNGANESDMVSVMVSNNNYGTVVSILERGNYKEVLKAKVSCGKTSFVSFKDSSKEIVITGLGDKEYRDGDTILVSYHDGIYEYVSDIEYDSSFLNQVKMMLLNTSIPMDFSNGAICEAKKISKIDITDEIASRVDLRNLLTVTIDGEEAKDLDDAVSLVRSGEGYKLYVHIADVSYYVRPGMNLFDEAYLRGTSVYPANYVFPMLPKEISNGVCSLNPQEDKLAKTVIITFDKYGNISDTNIVNSVIRSKIKMNYNMVNRVLLDNDIVPEYMPYIEMLTDMHNLATILNQKKIDRGAISFDVLELSFILGANAMVKDVQNREMGPAQEIIENFMLIANQVVSEYAYYTQIPFMFRNHDKPTVEQLNDLKYGLINCHSFFKNFRNLDNPKAMQKILKNISQDKSKIEARYYSSKVLSSMNRAYYSEENSGHYALALDEYGTFTSPIRRFPDLFNHYMIGEVISGRICNIDCKYNLEDMCKAATEKQIEAEKVERQVNNLLFNSYLSDFKDKELNATVVFVSKDFICVKTNELFYGNIPIKKKQLDREFKPGDKLVVVIDSVSEYNNEINFKICDRKVKTLKKEGMVK